MLIEAFKITLFPINFLSFFIDTPLCDGRYDKNIAHSLNCKKCFNKMPIVMDSQSDLNYSTVNER